MGKHATKECYKCHIRRPVIYLKQKQIRKNTGSSGMGFSFNPQKKQSVRINSGRSYYKNMVVWVCKNTFAHGNPQYYEQEEEKLIKAAEIKAEEKETKRADAKIAAKNKAEKVKIEAEEAKIEAEIKVEDAKIEAEKQRIISIIKVHLKGYKATLLKEAVNITMESGHITSFEEILSNKEIDTKNLKTILADNFSKMGMTTTVSKEGNKLSVTSRKKNILRSLGIKYLDGQSSLSAIGGSLIGLVILVYSLFLILSQINDFFSTPSHNIFGMIVVLSTIAFIFHKKEDRKKGLSNSYSIIPSLTTIIKLFKENNEKYILYSLENTSLIDELDKEKISQLIIINRKHTKFETDDEDDIKNTPLQSMSSMKDLARAMFDNDNFFELACAKLGKQLASVDNEVTKDEEKAFLEFVDISMTQDEKLVFDSIIKKNIPEEIIIKLILKKYAANKNVLHDIINNLFYVAESDGEITKQEVSYIKSVSDRLGLSTRRFNALKNKILEDYEENSQGAFSPRGSEDFIDDIFEGVLDNNSDDILD